MTVKELINKLKNYSPDDTIGFYVKKDEDKETDLNFNRIFDTSYHGFVCIELKEALK
jgi:hypothetical protein